MSRKRRSVADEPFLLVQSAWSDQTADSVIAGHAHGWHQLIYVAAGLAVVTTADGARIAPPSWAVWMPAGEAHTLRFVGASALRTLYLRPGSHADLPAASRSLAVSPLLKALILRTLDLGMLDARDPVEAAMATLLGAELGRSGPPPFALTRPRSALVAEAADRLAAHAPEAASIAALARALGMGARTLERRFAAETGLTPRRWQQHQRLLSSLEMIAGGMTVKRAAAAAGFASPSAYVAAFRRVFDTTPGRYFAAPAAALTVAPAPA